MAASDSSLPPRRGRALRVRRELRARPIALAHGGVAHRADLRAAGVTRADVRTEVAAGRWILRGRQTVQIGTGDLSRDGVLWRAVWESGSGAVLDGVSALIAGGLSGFTPDRVDVTIPDRNRRHRVPGVRLHRRRSLGPISRVGIPRSLPEHAALRGAQWATSDRQALLILCLVVQQRIVHPERLWAAREQLTPHRRRSLLRRALQDICDGAHALGELDFAALLRQRGLPEPSRQVVRELPNGRVYLDVRWDDLGLVVEIDGGHHAMALTPVDDALRQNDVVLTGETVLRIPVLGLRLQPDRFMDQVERGIRLTRERTGRRLAG
jgi:very-short-patch-repair endonuclease